MTKIFFIEKDATGKVEIGWFSGKRDAIDTAEEMISQNGYDKELYEWAALEDVPVEFDEDGEPCEWVEPGMSEEDAYYGALAFFRRDVQFFSTFDENEIEEFICLASKLHKKPCAIKLLKDLGFQ